MFNPSSIQLGPVPVVHDDDAEQAREDEEELRAIAAGIDERLDALDEVELDMDDDDDEEESVAIEQPRTQQQQIHSTPFTSQEEAAYLHKGKESDQLEILYKARGHEITRLKEELASVSSVRGGETRTLHHQLALLKGERDRLTVQLEHIQSVAQSQSEENQSLRLTVSDLKSKLVSSDEANKELANQIESTNIHVQTLQSQLVDLQRSDTILRAKQQHEETVRSLRERHDSEVFNMQQEIDRLTAHNHRLDAEADTLRSKASKSQHDHDTLLIEKSETIKELQNRLEASQKRLAQHISETSSQGYANVKAMHDRYKMDQERYALDVCAFKEEQDRLKSQLVSKDKEVQDLEAVVSNCKTERDCLLAEKTETIRGLQQRLSDSERRLNHLVGEPLTSTAIVQRLEAELQSNKGHLNLKEKELASTKGELVEAKEKYQSLKKKVRQYQVHCRNKEARFADHIRTTEDEYRNRLLSLRQKMEEAYVSKEQQVERELLDMKQFFHNQLTKVVTLSANDQPPSLEDEQDENRAPSTTEDLSKLLAGAKNDLRHRLKTPAETLTATNR